MGITLQKNIDERVEIINSLMKQLNRTHMDVKVMANHIGLRLGKINEDTLNIEPISSMCYQSAEFVKYLQIFEESLRYAISQTK